MVREAVAEVIFEAAALARKPRKKRRKIVPRCDVRGCTRIAPIVMDTLEAWCKTHAKREADKLARQFVLDRDAWTCQRCGSGGAGVAQWAHILSRSALAIRWDPDNSLVLCARCHQFFTLRPIDWQDWVDERYPGRWDLLRARRRNAEARGDKPDYAQIISDLRAKVGA